jgi:hypothetical protein
MSLIKFRSIPPARRSAPALMLAAAALALPACGGGGGESKPTAASIEASGRGGDVEVKAPTSIKGGLVRLNFKNSSDGPRDAQLIRVVGDHSPQEFLEVVQSEGGPIPEWIEDGGGVGTTAPGQTGWATQNLAEGRYFVVAMPEGEARPATAELRVEGGSPGELPEAPGEIVARDYTFDAKGLKPGKNTILFKNDGQQLHHVVGAPIRPGKTIDDVRKYAAQERPSGEPPLDQRSGFNTAVIDGGIEQVTEIDLKKPGKYALLCFIQDRNGGRPHVMKGMIKEVEVQ